jgi:hypothetical protein
MGQAPDRSGDTTMKAITLRAHFDGQHIELDEPFELRPNTELIVTILPGRPTSDEDAGNDEGWWLLSSLGLEAAYDEDEPEYQVTLIKEWNPEFI